MARKKQYKNESYLPNDQIEMLAKSIIPSITEFWESEEGQRVYNEYLSNKNTDTIISVSPMHKQLLNANK